MPSPDLLTCGEPEWYVTWLLRPEASIVSVASTVITLFRPDTVRLAQWPVITTVLETPLTVTVLLLQVSVWFSLIPVTVSSAPCGGSGVTDDGAGLCGIALGGLMTREVTGGEDGATRLPRANLCEA